MADYVAVAEAMKIAAKQTFLLREVMRIRSENSPPQVQMKTPASSKEGKIAASKK